MAKLTVLQPSTDAGSVAVQIARDDPRLTLYQVFVTDDGADSACVVTCSHEPDGDHWHGSCAQWRAWGRCPHLAAAQEYQRAGRPVTNAVPPALVLRQLRRDLKQQLPHSRPKPGRRKWRPTIVKDEDRRAAETQHHAADDEDRTVPPALDRERAERRQPPPAAAPSPYPNQKSPGHERWREFNQQTATKYKLEMPGHHCPPAWHTGPDGKCQPADQTHIEHATKERNADPTNVVKQHQHALAHLAGGTIESSELLDPTQSGINTTQLVQFKGDGQGIYKSQAGAAAFQHPTDKREMQASSPRVRYEMEHSIANQHRREAMFYDLEQRYFGTQLTPPTTLRSDSEGNEGSIQQFVPGARTVKAIPDDEIQQLVATDPCLKRSLEDLTALDLFGGHQDRRPPNLLVKAKHPDASTGKQCHEAVAIDNGFSGGPPTLGGHSHVGYTLGIKQLQPRHVAAAQKVLDAGMAPLIHRAAAVGLHPNVGKQHYLNAMFMAHELKTAPFERAELSNRYLEFLDRLSDDESQPHEVRSAATQALRGDGLRPFDAKHANDVITKWERAAAQQHAEERLKQEKERKPEDRLELEHAPTQLAAAAPEPVVVAVLHVGSKTPLAHFTLDVHGQLTVDNPHFVDELHQAPYHFSGAGKLWAIVQRNAHNSYQYLTFTGGTLEQLRARVPANERTLAPALQGHLDFEAQRQAYLRAKASK
jgi:hypothetical protein